MKTPLEGGLDGAGPVQLPPAAGEHSKRSIMAKPMALLHTVSALLQPALGCAFTATVTVALTVLQGGAPKTV
jgi:hypothetical protein